jgi:preprotein translocase subunit YajC
METIIQQALPIVLMLGLMYFMLFLPEKKRKSAFTKMISELKVNDEVTTRGGIVGKIIRIDDDTITLESGPDRTKIKFSKSAVATVRSQVNEQE